MNKEEKAKLWADRIQQCQTSGKTCKQWCAENGIPLSTMGYWIRRLAKEEPASESEQDLVFVRLPSEQEAARKLLSEESSPFERQAWGFAAVCGISIILTLFAFVIMRRKNMF